MNVGVIFKLLNICQFTEVFVILAISAFRLGSRWNRRQAKNAPLSVSRGQCQEQWRGENQDRLWLDAHCFRRPAWKTDSSPNPRGKLSEGGDRSNWGQLGLANIS